MEKNSQSNSHTHIELQPIELHDSLNSNLK